MSGREQIINAAFELFSEKNFDAVGIREIGERAGLTNPALYQHFRGKQALGEEVYRRSYKQLMDAIDKRMNARMTAIEKIHAYVDAAVALHALKPSPLLFLEDQQRHFGVLIKKEFGDQSVTARLGNWLQEGRQAGLIKAEAPDAFLIASIVGQVTKWAVMNSVKLAPKKNAPKWLKHNIEKILTTQ